MTGEDHSGVDIFQLLEAASEAKQRKNRQLILESLDVKEFSFLRRERSALIRRLVEAWSVRFALMSVQLTHFTGGLVRWGLKRISAFTVLHVS